jgi:hypothetical protein
MQLISYVKIITNKRLLISESHGDSNRCTSYKGKPDQHTTRFPHSVCVWLSTIRISHGPRIEIFHESSTGLDICTVPEKKMLQTPPLSPAEWSVRPALVSPPTQLLKQCA